MSRFRASLAFRIPDRMSNGGENIEVVELKVTSQGMTVTDQEQSSPPTKSVTFIKEYE